MVTMSDPGFSKAALSAMAPTSCGEKHVALANTTSVEGK